MLKKFSEVIVEAAISGFEAQKARLNEQIAELRAMLNGSSTGTAAAPETTPRKRRKMSASARRRIAAAQRARWAKVRGESGPALATKPARKKRKISPEGLRNIIAATKKRWRLQRAASNSAK
jgi:riboflavin biosynthesis pyrimidine reductase